jgi:hypothetical protein
VLLSGNNSISCNFRLDSSRLLFFEIISYYIIEGIILVVTIKPGDTETKSAIGDGTTSSPFTTQDAILDLIRFKFTN